MATLSPVQRLQRSALQLAARLRGSRPPVQADLEWTPSANFIVHDDIASTTVSFAALTTTRHKNARYFWEFRLFDTNPLEPIFVHRAGPLSIFDQDTLTSADICRAIGRDRLFNYCEVNAYSPDVQPMGVSSVLVSYNHFTSLDGSMEGHIPAAYIYGAARFTRTERFHYENFPASRVGKDERLVVYTINPVIRPSEYWIHLTDARGTVKIEGPFRVRGKGVSRWEGPATSDGLVNPVGVVVKSVTKTASFVGAVCKVTGRMTDLEHMHPFFAR